MKSVIGNATRVAIIAVTVALVFSCAAVGDDNLDKLQGRRDWVQEQKRIKISHSWKSQMEQAIHDNDSDTVLELFKNQPSREQTALNELYFLYLAIEQGNTKVVKIILDRGTDVNASFPDRNNPLHVAIRNGKIEVARLLLEQGANVNALFSSFTPLHIAVHKQQIAIAEMLLIRKANVNAADTVGNTALYRAVNNNSLAMVELLLKHGANPNLRNQYGQTGLHSAISLRGLKSGVLKVLLEHKANPNVKWPDGTIPLHLATEAHYTEAVALLLEHGADVHTKTNDGKTALDMAREAGFRDIIVLLRKHGAKGGEWDEILSWILYSLTAVMMGVFVWMLRRERTRNLAVNVS